MLPDVDISIESLRQAAGRPEVLEAMRDFYAEVDRRIAAEKPTCWNRGACCRFGEYGHRLYVTALEVAYYLALRTDPSLALGASSGNPSLVLEAQLTVDACPYAHDGRCHARDRRPLGCRIFYCDPNAQHWQGSFTEECLEELKRLHRELGVVYFYADWMAVLRRLAHPPADLRG